MSFGTDIRPSLMALPALALSADLLLYPAVAFLFPDSRNFLSPALENLRTGCYRFRMAPRTEHVLSLGKDSIDGLAVAGTASNRKF